MGQVKALRSPGRMPEHSWLGTPLFTKENGLSRSSHFTQGLTWYSSILQESWVSKAIDFTWKKPMI